jgi:hypothetical protein
MKDGENLSTPCRMIILAKLLRYGLQNDGREAAHRGGTDHLLFLDRVPSNYHERIRGTEEIVVLWLDYP